MLVKHTVEGTRERGRWLEGETVAVETLRLLDKAKWKGDLGDIEGPGLEQDRLVQSLQVSHGLKEE